MPRFIPRLLRALEHARSRPPRFTRRPPTPLVADKRVFTRPQEVDISPHGRSQSILLDRKAVRLIYRHARYQPTKSLAPEVRVSKARWRAKQAFGRAPAGVLPREMTQEERSYHANPYLRMLGSPLRQCFHTGWLLPREMLIRMTTMILPDSRPGKLRYAFLPNGLEHPRFTRFQGGRSSYVLCHQPVIEYVRDRGSYKRFSPDGGATTMHPLIAQQIGHILRVRVLQELQLLSGARSRRPALSLLRMRPRSLWSLR
ncbi:hypothetical protein PYCCODRAFT_152156 [Trametes coccinea BRFM310]|uniref:Uncharacterized protein n=1 Tax=Trametes coccinea (strain BRFM310) TaxID=1353009 RepID=A0A1Y2IWS4_TRAC3|nr:hypothetical protein PYCCODRAFT_152156 [Trametes coccinea BRFM310]